MNTRIACLAIVAVLISSCGEKKTATDMMEDFAKDLPRGSLGGPSYFLEMNGSAGWEPVILNFGYTDNLNPCKALAGLAKRDSPKREFRCKAAN